MNSDSTPRGLTFDDLGDLSRLGVEEAVELLRGRAAIAIGPAVEYAMLLPNADAASRLTPFPLVVSIQESVKPLAAPATHLDTSLAPRDYEVVRLPSAGNYDLGFTPFRKRMECAAVSAGISATIAQGLAGALGEMVDNIFEHAKIFNTALAAYRWVAGEFEFVVADNGIGVLASLRSNPRYQHLIDSGRALETAIQKGESSIDDCGRGMGFTELITQLVNLNGTVRLRSGDHWLGIELQEAELLPRIGRTPLEYQGLMVSFSCRPQQ